MSKVKAIILAGFLVAFAAGLVTGMQTPRRHPVDPPRHAQWLASELNLTPAQSEQLQQIWSKVSHAMQRDQEEPRRNMRKQRDDAIVALLSPEQKAAYDKIQQEYAAQVAKMDEQHRKAVEDAVQQTRQILTEPQRAKYEELLKRRAPEGHGPPPWREPRPATRATTSPAGEQAS